MRKLVLSTGVLALLAVACSEPPAITSVPARLELTLNAPRISADEGEVLALARLFDQHETPIGGEAVEMTTSAGTVEAVTDNQDGTYTLRITELRAAGEFKVAAKLGELTAEITGTVIPGKVDVAGSVLNVAPATAAADGASAMLASVLAVDAHGNPLGESATVTIAALGSTASVEKPAWHAESGQWRAGITNTRAEKVTVSASVNGLDLAGRVPVEFVAPNYRVELTAAAASAQVTTSVALSARVVQVESGQALAGRTVVLVADSPTAQLSGYAMLDNGDGTYSASVLDTRIGKVRVTARDLESSTSTVAEVTFTSGGANALSISTDLQVLSADFGKVNATARLTDVVGNPIAGRQVTFSSPTGTVGAVTDKGDGSYTAEITNLSSAGIARITASLAGVPSASTTVQVNPGGIDAAKSTVTVSSTTVAADGKAKAVLVATPTDKFGNRLGPNQRVTVESSSTTAVIGAVLDLGDGSYAATVSDTRAGAFQLSARVGSFSPILLQTRPTVTFDAPQYAVTVTASQSTLSAGQSTLLTARIAAVPSGQLAAGRTLNFVIVAGRGASVGPITETSPGVFTAELVSTVAEPVLVLASDSASSSNGFIALAYAAETTAASVHLTAARPSITADDAEVLLSAVVRDRFGNPIPGLASGVSIEPSGGVAASPTEDPGGRSYSSRWNLLTRVGNYTARAKFGAIVSNTLALEVAPGKVDSSRSSAELRPSGGVQADGLSSALLIVTPRDKWENLLGRGLTVSATSTGTGQVARSPLTDLGDGNYLTTISNQKAETITVTATAKRGSDSTVTLTQKPTISFVAPTHTLTLNASPQTLIAGEISTITITLKKSDGTPVPNRGPALAVTAVPSSQVALSNVTDKGAGVYELTASNNGAGTVTVRAVDATSGAVATQMLTWQAGSPAVLELSAFPQTVSADTAESTLTARLRDQFGNGVPGRTVNLSIQSGPGTVGGPTMNGAGSDGTYRGTISGLTEAGKQTLVRAESGGLVAALVLHTTVGAPASITGFAASATSISADAGQTTLSGTVKDGSGNVVPFAKVALTVNHGKVAGAASATVSANASGVFSQVWDGLGREGTWKATALTGSASASVDVTVTRGSDAGFRFVAPAQGSTTSPVVLTADDHSGEFDLLFKFVDAGDNQIEGREAGFTVKVDGAAAGAVAWDAALRTYKSRIPALSLGQHTVEVADSVSGLTATGYWTLAPGAPTSAALTLTASTVDADVGTLSATVVVKDQHDNFVTGLTGSEVALAWSPKSPGNAYSATPAVETGPGTYKIDVRNARSAGEYQVTAVVKGSLTSPASQLTVTTGTAFLITQPLLSPNITADTGSATATFSIRDAFGNPVTSGTPTVSLTGGNPEATATVAHEGGGNFKVTLENLFRSTAAGATWSLRASLGSLQSNPTGFTVFAGAPTSVTLALSAANIVTDTGAVNADVSVRDQRGNPVPALTATDFALTWTPSNPGSPVTFTVTEPTLGNYRLAVSGLRLAGSYEATVKVKGVATSPTAPLAIAPGAAKTITSPVVSGPITADVATAQATFKVRDNYGNGVSGAAPTATLTGGNPEATVSVTEVGNGDYRADLGNLWKATSAGATWRVQAKVGTTITSTQTSFTVLAGPPASATLTASAATVTADSGAVNLIAAVADSRGNAVTGLAGADFVLSWTATPPAPYAAAAAVSTTPAGSYRISVTGLRTVGSYEAMVTVKTTLASTTATVGVTAGAPASITAPVLAGAVDADNGTARVDFTIRDAFQNPVSGRTPVVAVTGGNTDAVAGAVVDDGAGSYHAELSKLYKATSANAAWKVVATLGTLTSTQTAFDVAAGAPSLATTLIGGAAAGTAGQNAAVEVQVKDQRENLLGAGTTVTLRVKGAGTGGDAAACSVAAQPAFNSTTGVYDAQVTSTAAQDCVFDAYLGTADQAFTADDHTVTFAAP